MKNFGKYASLMLMVLLSSIMLVACGKAKIESASIKEGTLPTYIYTNDEFDVSDAVAIVKWSNKKTTYVDAKDLTFDMKSLDLSTVGEKELAITYNDFNFTYTFEVRERGQVDPDEKYTVGSVESELVTAFINNSASNKENKETQFAITNSTTAMVNNIKAGSNNNFDFRMKAFGEVDGTMDYMDNSLLKTNVEVLIKNGTDFSAIGDDVYGDYVEKVNNTSIKFAKGAEGKTFKINVKITNAKKDNLGFSIVVDVVNGYNVYNAKDLSVFDNTNRYSDWTDLKNAWGLSEVDSNSISSIILQDNIYINDDVVPASNFWSESEVEGKGSEWRNKTNQTIVGSLKDIASSGIYYRTLVDGEKFTVYGNYFSIDVSDQKDGSGNIVAKGLSRSVMDNDDNGIVLGENSSYITTHTPLFRVNGAVLNADDGTRTEVGDTEGINTATISYQDVRFLGNGARSNSALESGGIILAKSCGVNLDVHNTIMKDFFIGWFTECGYNRTLPTDVDAYLTKYYPNYTLTGVSDADKQARLEKYIINDGNKDLNCSNLIKDSKGYNSYNTLMYIWGTPKLVIENSEFLECGGPAIIADHVTGDGDPGWSYNYNPNTGEGGLPTNIDIINTNIASHVTGTESWFATFGATSAVNTVKIPNTVYTNFNSSYLGTYGEIKDCFNMVVLMKWGAKKFAEQAIFTRGSVRIFDDRADYESFVTTGKLADGSDYYPYDLSADYDESGRYVYTQKPALAHLTQLGYAQASEDATSSAETIRISSDKNGESLQCGGANLASQTEINADKKIYATHATNFADANYFNFMLTNGFGLIAESNPGK